MAGWISIGFGGDVGTDFRAGWLIRHPPTQQKSWGASQRSKEMFSRGLARGSLEDSGHVQ